MKAALHFAGRHGRFALIAGLAAGLALPDLAQAMRPWLPVLLTFILGLAAFRIGPKDALGALHDLTEVVGLALVYQIAVPLVLTAVFWALGLHTTALATILVLLTSAPSVSASPPVASMCGGDPAPALRLLIAGTALMPLTILPVFLIHGGFGGALPVIVAALRLLGVIVLAAGIAFALRHLFLRRPDADALTRIDGLAAIALAVIVIGLMSAVGPALRDKPGTFLAWLAVAMAANLGLQIAAALLLKRTGPRRTAYSVVSGNRNIALFLIAMPEAVTEEFLLFLGCYQFPMYLTPVLLRGFYRRLDRA